MADSLSFHDAVEHMSELQRQLDVANGMIEFMKNPTYSPLYASFSPRPFSLYDVDPWAMSSDDKS